MPHVGDEQLHIDGLSLEHSRSVVLPGRERVRQLTDWGRLGGQMAERDDTDWPARSRTVLEQDTSSHREHRMRNPNIPIDTLGQGYMRAGIDVPETASMSVFGVGRITPRRVSDDVTILTQEKLYDVEDPSPPNGLMAYP